MKKRINVVILAGLTAVLLFVAGCSQPIESTARDGIASASGFLKQEVAANTEACQASPSAQKCVAIKKAAQTLTVAIDALEAYCGGAQFNAGTGPCQAPNSATLKQQLADKLTAALSDLNRDVTDVKAVTASYYNGIPVNRADFTGGGILALIGLLLPILRGLLQAVTKNNLPAEVIDAVQAAIVALEKVHDTPVTRQQLEGLKVEVPW